MSKLIIFGLFQQKKKVLFFFRRFFLFFRFDSVLPVDAEQTHSPSSSNTKFSISNVWHRSDHRTEKKPRSMRTTLNFTEFPNGTRSFARARVKHCSTHEVHKCAYKRNESFVIHYPNNLLAIETLYRLHCIAFYAKWQCHLDFTKQMLLQCINSIEIGFEKTERFVDDEKINQNDFTSWSCLEYVTKTYTKHSCKTTTILCSSKQIVHFIHWKIACIFAMCSITQTYYSALFNFIVISLMTVHGLLGLSVHPRV